MYTTIRNTTIAATAATFEFASEFITAQVIGEPDDQLVEIGCRLVAQGLNWAINMLAR